MRFVGSLGSESLPLSRRVLAWSLWPATVAVSVTGIAALEAGGLTAWREAVFVAAPVLLTAAMVLAFMVARQGLTGSIGLASITLLYAAPVAFMTGWWLGSSGRDVGAVCAMAAAAFWFVAAFVTAVVTADRGDRYGPGGWAP
jgi:hypothetical protein